MIWKIKYTEKWRQGFSNDRAAERVKGEEGRERGCGGWEGAECYICEKKNTDAMYRLKDDMFPWSRWWFFRALLSFSDFAQILLFRLELRARAPVFSPIGLTLLSQRRGFRVSGSSSSLCFWGDASPTTPWHGRTSAAMWILFVIRKTNTATELSMNRCCRSLDPWSYRLCWKQGGLFYSPSVLLRCEWRVGSWKLNYVNAQEFQGECG